MECDSFNELVENLRTAYEGCIARRPGVSVKLVYIDYEGSLCVRFVDGEEEVE